MDRSNRVNPVLRRVAFLGNLGAIIFPAGAVALAAVPVVLAYQIRTWFEAGRWPAMSFADGLRWVSLQQPHFRWTTLQHTSDTLMAAPLSLVLLFGVGGALFSYAQFSKWLERYCEPEKAEHRSAD